MSTGRTICSTMRRARYRGRSAFTFLFGGGWGSSRINFVLLSIKLLHFVRRKACICNLFVAPGEHPKLARLCRRCTVSVAAEAKHPSPTGKNANCNSLNTNYRKTRVKIVGENFTVRVVVPRAAEREYRPSTAQDGPPDRSSVPPVAACSLAVWDGQRSTEDGGNRGGPVTLSSTNITRESIAPANRSAATRSPAPAKATSREGERQLRSNLRRRPTPEETCPGRNCPPVPT